MMMVILTLSVGSTALAESKQTFWHDSFVETESGTNAHRVHLSPTDVSFITNMGWVSADTLAGALVVTEVISSGAGVVLGGVATIAVLTLSWAEQNDDGSLDIWIPQSALRPLERGKTGWVQIGKHWFPVPGFCDLSLSAGARAICAS